MITGIVVALSEELNTLTSKKLEKGCVQGLADKILVIYSGAGVENARTASELLITQGANQLISWGCAAALDGEFRSGDLVLANACVDADHVAIDLNNEAWLVNVKNCLSKHSDMRIHTGKLAESKNIVASSNDKAKIAEATDAIALDMESVAIAKVAQAHGLPFLSIRAIADPVNMDLPKAVSHALNEQGDVILGKLLTYLMWHPAELPGLIKLGLHFHAAKKTLRLVAKQLSDVIASHQSASETQPNNI
ncbi:phosphorylase [Methyloglobulus sp.]|uniref:phosphorylase family protein n=1 Tax=Methyloglobulus sp. TaxID=2518622 RepID=UPI0032B7C0C3